MRSRLGLSFAVAVIAGCVATMDGADTGEELDPGTPGSGAPRPGGAGGVLGDASVPGAGGTPGTAGSAPGSADAGAPPAAVPGSPVLFSEIMYHPVAENAPEEQHEFVEIHNRSGAAVSLAGWKIQGVIRYTFPAAATIGPQRYLVVAKNRDSLLALRKYALAAADVVGPFTGNLDNGGGQLRLLDDRDRVMDAVTYDDDFPWPMAADAFGAGEAWLRKPYAPLAQHQYMGCSLQRFSFDVPASEIANWDASDIDGATPGRPNPRAGDPPAIAEAVSADPASGVVRVRLSARGAVKELFVKHFVDVLDKDDEPVAMARMTKGADAWEATLPVRPPNTIVRYQIWIERGQGQGPVQLSPRPSDPYQWHAVFTSPTVATKARVYHLFIDTAKWQQMYTNVAPDGGDRPRRVLADRCTVNPNWNARVPATLAHEGKVYDVQVRYSGSDLNRLRGLPVASFPYPRPALPTPFRVLGLKVKFPRYRSLEGRPGIKLNKLNQSCPGITEYLGGRLFNAAGIPGSDPRWVRVYINGGYYHYMMETEERAEKWLERRQPAGAPVGDLFKVQGLFDGEDGPYMRADFSPLRPNVACNIKAADRYPWNYARKTHEWKTGNEVQAAIEGLLAARNAGTLRAYLEQTFDVTQVLTYIAIRNWSGAWDDGYHNHMLYRRPDGKWTLIPLDHDREFGVGLPATASFYMGEVGDPNNGPGTPGKLNWIKDAFFKTFRAEYNRRLLELDKTLLDPAAVARTISEGAAQFSVGDWNASPAAKPDQSRCVDPNTSYAAIRQFAQERHEQLLRVIK